MANDNTPSRPLARVESAELVSGVVLADSAGFPLGETHADGGTRHAARRPFSLHLLLRYKWTMTVVLGVLAPVALVLIWTTLRPEYRATAIIEIRSAVPRYILPTEDTIPKPGSQYEQYVLTQAAIMRSTKVLERVLDRDEVKETAWYSDPPSFWSRLFGAPTTPLERLEAAVNAAPRRRTELVEIITTVTEPQSAAVLANAVLDVYLNVVKERLSETDKDLREALRIERDTLEVDISLAEQEITLARTNLRTGSPDELIAQRRIRLDKLEGELQQIEVVDLALAQDQLKDYEAAAAAATQPTGDDVRSSAYQSDPEWRRLNAAWQDARRDRAQVAVQFQEAHPLMEQATRKMEFARQAVTERETQLEQLARSGITPPALPGSAEASGSPVALRAQIRRLESQRKLLKDRWDDLQKPFNDDFSTAERLRRTTDSLQRSKDKRAAVMKRLEELSEKDRVPAGSISPFSKATVPTTAAEDKRLKLSAAALAAALAAAVGCAYLRLMLSPQVQEANDLDPAVRSAFLGYLPLWSSDEDERLRDLPLHAEAVRMTRTALLNRLRALGGNIVQITSAGPGSGKSTFAVHLSRSLAQCGKRVLLVDVDLHRPTVAKFFTMDSAPGLLNLLARNESPAAAVRSTVYPGLSVIPAGVTTNIGDLELLANGAFTSLLAQWRKQYDVVVLDSPPLLVTADAAILSHHADGTVLVVRERHCHRGQLVEALAALSAAGGKLLGTVFVGSGPRGSGAYGYGYGYGNGDAYSGTLLDARTDKETPG